MTILFIRAALVQDTFERSHISTVMFNARCAFEIRIPLVACALNHGHPECRLLPVKQKMQVIITYKPDGLSKRHYVRDVDPSSKRSHSVFSGVPLVV